MCLSEATCASLRPLWARRQSWGHTGSPAVIPADWYPLGWMTSARPGSQALEGSVRSILHPVCPGDSLSKAALASTISVPPLERQGRRRPPPPELGLLFRQRWARCRGAEPGSRFSRAPCTAGTRQGLPLVLAPTQRAQLRPPLASNPTQTPLQASDSLFLSWGTWSSSRRQRAAQRLLRCLAPSGPALPCPHFLSPPEGDQGH